MEDGRWERRGRGSGVGFQDTTRVHVSGRECERRTERKVKGEEIEREGGGEEREREKGEQSKAERRMKRGRRKGKYSQHPEGGK